VSAPLRTNLVERRLSRLQSHVCRNIDGACSLQDAATIVGLERKYFSAFFKAKVGIRFSHWLRQVRIRAASELLRTCNYSVAEIAYSVGFKDLRTFQRAFKSIRGETPSQYRTSVNATRTFSSACGSVSRNHDKCRDAHDAST